MAISIQSQSAYSPAIPIATQEYDAENRLRKQCILPLRNSVTITSIKSTLYNKRTNYRGSKRLRNKNHQVNRTQVAAHPLNEFAPQNPSPDYYQYEYEANYNHLGNEDDVKHFENVDGENAEVEEVDIDEEEEIEDDYSYDDYSLSSESSHSTSTDRLSSLSASSHRNCYCYFSYNNNHHSFSYVSKSSRYGSVINIPKSVTSSLSSSAPSVFSSYISSSSPLATTSVSKTASFAAPSIVTNSAMTATTETSPAFTISSNDTHRSLHKSSSTESLYKVLKTQDSLDLKKKASPISKLTNSFRSWKDSLQRNLSTYSLLQETPRMTDDVLPPIAASASGSRWAVLADVHEAEEPEDDEDEKSLHQELTTFECADSNDVEYDSLKTPSCKSFKNRDNRINSSFLRLYAFDYNARMNSKTLPNTASFGSGDTNVNQTELFRLVADKPQLLVFHHRYNVCRISNMSRDKLWNSVILPPRSDDSPLLGIDCNNYVFLGNADLDDIDYLLTRKSGNYLPWDSTLLSLRPTLKPAGILYNGKTKPNGMAPNSGFTKTQFTVKGWCNPRWMDCSS